jgi:hypothetical protein
MVLVVHLDPLLSLDREKEFELIGKMTIKELTPRAKAALEKGDLTPVLKWVKKEQEEEVRAAFAKTLAVRTLSPQAKDLADTYFFETLVRVHRAAEGAPYTGLEPADTPVSPAVSAADEALTKRSAGDLVKLLTDKVAKGVEERFEVVMEKKKHAEESVEAGREYVQAYVGFTHLAERLYDDATAPAGHHAGEQE